MYRRNSSTRAATNGCARARDGTVEIGISDHAQQALGDLVFVEVPDVGRSLSQGEACAVVESVKAASDVYAPVAGTVVAVNEALAKTPELINQDPYGSGWIMRLKPTRRCAAAGLLDAAAYTASLTRASIGPQSRNADAIHSTHRSRCREMLAAIGARDIETLFEEIPAELRVRSLAGVPAGLNEQQVMQLMYARARQDGRPLNFIGAGAYEHHIPAAVWAIVSRGEFYSAYTPYQAEASQGTLQTIYEYQSMITALTGMRGRQRFAVRRRDRRRGGLPDGGARESQVHCGAHSAAAHAASALPRRCTGCHRRQQGLKFEETAVRARQAASPLRCARGL